jgi:hypothetical protein
VDGAARQQQRSCNGGTPAGSFWTAKAIGLSARANGQLGPGYPSQPY